MKYSGRVMAWSVSSQNDWRDVRGISVARTEITPGKAPVYRMEGKSAAREFEKLAAQWKDETLDMSSFTDMLTHPAYLRIIAMSEKALPFLFDELRLEPNHWFAALSAITGQDDLVPETANGNLDEMSDIWLRWADQHGY